MKILIFFLFFIFLSLLESTIFPLNLVLLVVICLVALRPGKEAIMLGFFSGLMVDLIKGTILGKSSLLFIFLSLLIYLYQKRFQPTRLAFLLPFTSFSLVLTDYVNGLVFSPLFFGMEMILLVLFLPVLKFLLKSNPDDQQLKLSV